MQVGLENRFASRLCSALDDIVLSVRVRRWPTRREVGNVNLDIAASNAAAIRPDWLRRRRGRRPTFTDSLRGFVLRLPRDRGRVSRGVGLADPTRDREPRGTLLAGGVVDADRLLDSVADPCSVGRRRKYCEFVASDPERRQALRVLADRLADMS